MTPQPLPDLSRRAVAQDRVERWPADLRESCDLGLRDAGGESLGREFADRRRLGADLLASGGALAPVRGKCFTERVHRPSVKHLTTGVQGRKVLYMMTATRTVQKVQVYFIAFPGIEPLFPGSKDFDGIGGGSPYIDAHPYDDEKIQDVAMEMADWALETNPDLFDLDDYDDDGYSGYNQASSDIAGAIATSADTLGTWGRDVQEPANPFCSWRWKRDLEIVPGVVVRCAFFEYEERR